MYFKKYYKDNPNFDTLFLTFYDRWFGESPAFNIADGWQEVSVQAGADSVAYYWLYDGEKDQFLAHKVK